jgi:ornithine carbamoyltransferase
VQGKTVAFVGDGNNVANSLAHACLGLGINVHIASPEGYALDTADALRASGHARFGAHLRLFVDPGEAVREAHAVYTDVWASMGKEAEKGERDTIFRPYQVNDALMAQAQPGALFMHCLPAHRGDEVTDSVIDSTVSVVFDQAENRLHVQKAILYAIVRA